MQALAASTLRRQEEETIHRQRMTTYFCLSRECVVQASEAPCGLAAVGSYEVVSNMELVIQLAR